jgi:hypothetical protein
MAVMQLGSTFPRLLLLAAATVALTPAAWAQNPRSPSTKPGKKVAASEAELEAGSLENNVYRNKTLGFTCKIPEGWVLRTDEMNAQEEERAADSPAGIAPASSAGAKVLLAAFSRPPEAKGADVNSSILIAAESAAAYPGLKEAAQYFGPLTEVAKAQGFTVDEQPYEIAAGNRTLVRGDFHKDIATRVMRQSTLAMLAHGYAVSITVIGGSADEVEALIDGLRFGATGK